MASLADLPVDIIIQILFRFAIPDYHMGLRVKQAFLFIAVCRGWRQAAISYPYKDVDIGVSGFIDSSKSKTPLKHHIDTIENVGLFDQNGLNHFATNLNLKINTLYCDVGVDLLGPILRVMAGPFAKIDSAAPSNIDSVVALFVGRFPNIASIVINCDVVSAQLSQVFNRISKGYSDKLAKLAYRSQTFTLEPLLTACPLELDIHLSGVFSENMPKIQIDKLSSLMWVFQSPIFSWSMFQPTCAPNTYLFANLKELHLTNGSFDRTLSHGSNVQSDLADDQRPILKFPMLNTVSLNHVHVDDSFRAILNSPVTQVHFEGYFVDAIALCKFGIAKLDILGVQIYFDRLEEIMDEELRDGLNELFLLARGPKRVECSLNLDYGVLDLRASWWPNLTHLELPYGIDIDDLFKLLSIAPDLVELRVMPYDISDPGVVDKSIQKLLQEQRGPVVTKLRVLKMVGLGLGLKMADDILKPFQPLKTVIPGLTVIVEKRFK